MKMSLRVFFIILLIQSLLSSCDYYEKRQVEQVKHKLSAPRYWPEIHLPPPHDKFKLSLKTSWRDDKLFYVLVIEPYKTVKPFHRYGSNIDILLSDKNGFVIFSQNVYLSGMSRGVNSKGEPEDLNIAGDKECSMKTYKDLASWNVKYTLSYY